MKSLGLGGFTKPLNRPHLIPWKDTREERGTLRKGHAGGRNQDMSIMGIGVARTPSPHAWWWETTHRRTKEGAGSCNILYQAGISLSPNLSIKKWMIILIILTYLFLGPSCLTSCYFDLLFDHLFTISSHVGCFCLFALIISKKHPINILCPIGAA